MGHTFTNNLFHIIFSTKGRIGLIRSDFKNDLNKYISGIAESLDSHILKINGIDNHIHIPVKIKPSISVSDFVCKLKSNSSKWISENFELSYGFQWQGGFSSFSVSESQAAVISQYIDSQEEHHKKFTFEKELEDFLRKNKIAFEEKHFLD